MSKKECWTFFLCFFIAFWLVQAGADSLLSDEGLRFADAIVRPSTLIGAFCGSAVATGIFAWRKNKLARKQ